MGFNINASTGVAAAAQMSSETYSAKSYMEGVLATLAGANGSTPPSVILNAYQFLNSMETAQNFVVTMGPDGEPISSTLKAQTFDFSFLTTDQKNELKTKSDALFSSYAEKVQDPNNNNAADLPLVDQTPGPNYGQNATLLMLLQNPKDSYLVTADCNGSIDNPNWAPDLKDNYQGGDLYSHDTSSFSEDNGAINIDGRDHSVYYGGGETFKATASGSEWEKYATIQASTGTGPDSTSTTKAALEAFLDKNM